MDSQALLADEPINPQVVNNATPIHECAETLPHEDLELKDSPTSCDLSPSPPAQHDTFSSTSSDQGIDLVFWASESYNADPINIRDVHPEVLRTASKQVAHIPLEHLYTVCCAAQQGRGVPTLWSCAGDKLACWDCYTSQSRVCVRWLRGNEFIILPLVAWFRREDAEPSDRDYWIWDGIVRGAGV